MWALIEDGVVAEKTDVDPAGRYHPDLFDIAWFDGRSKVDVGWLWDGENFSPPRAPTITKNEALRRIDEAADRARSSGRSTGLFLDAEYRFVLDGLAEYRSDPDGKIPQSIRQWADIEGITIAEAAEQIAEAAGRYEDLLLEVRRIRLTGKAAIRNATEGADFAGLAQGYVEQLEALELKGAEGQDDPQAPVDEGGGDQKPDSGEVSEPSAGSGAGNESASGGDQELPSDDGATDPSPEEPGGEDAPPDDGDTDTTSPTGETPTEKPNTGIVGSIKGKLKI